MNLHINLLALQITLIRVGVWSKTIEDIVKQQGIRSFPDKFTVVQVNYFIRAIEEINDADQSIKLQLTFRQEWEDERLKHEEVRHPYFKVNSSSIWTPDLFFLDEVEGHRFTLMRRNEMLRVYEEGNVLYSERISLRLRCPMDHSRYPFDEQICTIRIGSYAHPVDDITLAWLNPKPVKIAESVYSMPKFKLKSFENWSNCTSRTRTGTYNCLNTRLHLKRYTGRIITDSVLPQIMWMTLSWASFWFDPKSNAALRLTFALVPLIMIVFNIRDQMDLISTQVTTLDHWNGWCVTYAFIGLLQNVIVLYLASERKQGATEVKGEPDEGPVEEANVGKVTDPEQGRGETLRRLTKMVSQMNERIQPLMVTNRLDYVTRIVLPVAFVLFTIIFFLSA